MSWEDVLKGLGDWLAAGALEKMALGVAVFVVGMVLARIVRALVKAATLRGSKDETLARFLAGVTYQVLRVVVIIAALGSMGVDTTPLAAMIGGLGVALGFALRDTISNFAAGVLIILRRPFEEGHFIEVAGVAGVVEEITIVATRMRSPDNKSILIPNGQVFGGVITNYNGNDTRRVDLVAGIGYSDDIDKARDELFGILRAHPLVLSEPEPVVVVGELADSSVNFNVRPWCKTADYWTVYADVTESIKKRFDAAGISIPFPQQDVHMHTVA